MTPGRFRDPARPLPSWPVLGGAGESAGEPLALTGRVVLIPRAPQRAARLAQLLHDAGATALVSPVTQQVAADAGSALHALADCDWVAVTSVNTVNVLVEAASRLGITLSNATSGPDSAGGRECGRRTSTTERSDGESETTLPAAGLKWAAVGPATARALQDAGIRVDLVPQDHSAAGMVDAFTQTNLPPGTRVLLPQADLASSTLEQGLVAQGAEPRPVVVYRTVPCDISGAARRAWETGQVDAVVLTSGSTAHQVAAQLGPRPDVVGVAIGQPTALAAAAAGLRVDGVAAQATDEAVFAALVDVLTSDNATGTASAKAPSTSSGTPAVAASPNADQGPAADQRTVPSATMAQGDES